MYTWTQLGFALGVHDRKIDSSAYPAATLLQAEKKQAKVKLLAVAPIGSKHCSFSFLRVAKMASLEGEQHTHILLS